VAKSYTSNNNILGIIYLDDACFFFIDPMEKLEPIPNRLGRIIVQNKTQRAHTKNRVVNGNYSVLVTSRTEYNRCCCC